jgi:hypothetical protein
MRTKEVVVGEKYQQRREKAKRTLRGQLPSPLRGEARPDELRSDGGGREVKKEA